MHFTNLRKVGGSVMLVVSPALLEVGVVVEQPVIKPNPKSRYTLDSLFAASDYSMSLSDDEREWIDAPLVGKEIW